MENWARRTSWGWWDDTAFQAQDSKFKPWRFEAEHATSWSRRLPTILNLYEWAGKKHFVSLKLEGLSGVRTRDLWLSKQAALTTAPGPPPPEDHCPDHNTPSPWPLSVNDTAQIGRLTRGNDHHRYTDITSVTYTAGTALAQRPYDIVMDMASEIG